MERHGNENKRSKFEAELPAEPNEPLEPFLDCLPNHILALVLVSLEYTDLASAMCTSQRLAQLAADELLWEELWKRRFGDASTLAKTACLAAGGWKNFFAERHHHGKAPPGIPVAGTPPATTPSHNEKLSACLRLIPHDAGSAPAVIFALDGSGSVSEDEFGEMTSFVLDATATLRESHPEVKVSVLQFSNDVREEWSMDLVPAGPAFNTACRSMVRMNGGTNISLAMQRAGQVMKRHTHVDSHKSLVFVTDGRVDPYQAKEARQEAARLADEQRNITLFAFGVGRGVDRSELLLLLAAAPPRKSIGSSSSPPSTPLPLGSAATPAGPSSYSPCSSSLASGSTGSGSIGTASSITTDSSASSGLPSSPSCGNSTPAGIPVDQGMWCAGDGKCIVPAYGGGEGGELCTPELSFQQKQRIVRLAAARGSLRGLDLTPATERYMDLYVREDAPW